MLAGLAQLLLWQTLGECVSRCLLPTIPGPVIGLIGLLCFLVLKKDVNPSLNNAGASLRQHLGLLFVPAAAGIVLFLPELKAHWVAYLLVLLLSMGLTVASSALLLKLLRQEK